VIATQSELVARINALAFYGNFIHSKQTEGFVVRDAL